jgi:hypothetical protein
MLLSIITGTIFLRCAILSEIYLWFAWCGFCEFHTVGKTGLSPADLGRSPPAILHLMRTARIRARDSAPTARRAES